MSRESSAGGVLPATQHNVLTGACWAALIFPQLVGLGYSAFFGVLDGEFLGYGGFPAVATTYLVTAIVSAVPGLIAILVIGIPLSLLASRIMKRSTSSPANIAVQFIAGTVSGILPAVLALASLTGIIIDESTVLFILPPVVAAGISAALGWRIALASARRTSRKAHTPNRDAIAEDGIVSGA